MEIKSTTGAMTISENAPEFIIDPELQTMIAPLTADETTMLEENIISDGTVREPLTVWSRTIVDGHHRWSILQRNPDIPFTVQYAEFPDRQSAVDWMICNQLGRRNVTDEQRKYLLGKMFHTRKSTRGGDHRSKRSSGPNHQRDGLIQNNVAVEIAAEQHVSKATVERAAQYAQGLDAAEVVSPGFRDKILTGEIKSVQADIASLRNLPESNLLEAVRHIENGERPLGAQKTPMDITNRSSPLPERNQIPDSFDQSIHSSPAPSNLSHDIASTVKAHRYCPVDDPRIIPEDNATKGLERIAESNHKMRIISDDDDEMTVEDILLEFVLAREDAENLLRAVWDRDHALIMNNPQAFLEQLAIISRTVRRMKQECCPEVIEPEKGFEELKLACEESVRGIAKVLGSHHALFAENPLLCRKLIYDAMDGLESLCEQYES